MAKKTKHKKLDLKRFLDIKNVPIIGAILVILLSIGYSAFGTNMNITGTFVDVRVEADIRVTDVSVSDYTNQAVSYYENYNVSNISSTINLPNADSSITYKVKVTNFGNTEMGIRSITGLPSNLDYEISGYTLQDRICDANNQCKLGISKEFYITVKYKSGGYNSSSTNYALTLNFDFQPFYTVIYEGFSYSGNYQSEVIGNGDLIVNFEESVLSLQIKINGVTLDQDSYIFDSDQGYLHVPGVSGNVTVTNVEPSLITLLLNQYSGSKTGLVQDSVNDYIYYYKGTNGQVANNYLWYGGHQWRVLEFNTVDNTVLLISQQPLTSIYPNASATILNNWLSNTFYNSLDSSIQNNIVNSPFNTGVSPNFTVVNKKVGLLSVEQYDRAGEADSYLDIKDYWYTSDLVNNTRTVRTVGSSGMLTTGNVTSTAYGVRPVIRINDILISGGKGTMSSSYKTSDKSTSTSNVQVGEYISVPYNGTDGACGSDKLCTFRVVSDDSDSIKVVLNGLLPTKSSPTTQMSMSNPVYNVLTPFANNISTYYRYGGSKSFYSGLYAPHQPNVYYIPTYGTYSSNIATGVPSAGEIFSGNDLDLSTSIVKTFVDVNTLENPTSSTRYWISQYDESYLGLNMIDSSGRLDATTGSYGVRPSLYLNKGITFVSGDGTAQNPYVLEAEPEPNLISSLLSSYSSGNTTGLVQDSVNDYIYYYKGTNSQVANNYLWYGGHQWRVLEFNTVDNSLLLISQQPLTAIQPSGIGWTSQAMYEASYVNDWLNDYFYNSLDSKIKGNILNNTFNVGISSNVSEITTTQKVGLLDVGQYKRAGGANSYLDIKDSFWLGNRYSSSYIINVDRFGSTYVPPSMPGSESSNITYDYNVRPVIKISDILITEGDGTLTNSYKMSDKSTSTSNVQVGEYINVPYSGTDGACGSDKLCTFRVVSKDSDSIKVVLNGLLPSTSTYGSSAKISTSSTIYTPLNTFANNISTSYRYVGSNKTFYIGDYPASSNYTAVKDESIYATVGLPTVGEMFSGNDIDLYMGSTKTFVDINTIENPIIAAHYWTMNRSSSSYVRTVNSTGNMEDIRSTNNVGIRPVIYLKSNLTFTGGKGTAQNPYTLS